MIVKNEEKELSTCLESVSGLVDEIIIVDTGSTDGTVEIAQCFKARVVKIEWPGDFALARNMSITMAVSDWILVLDADEYLDQASAVILKKAISTTKGMGLQVCVRNLQPPGELVKYQDNHIIRIFRNLPGIQYEGLIHESVLPSIKRLEGTIEKVDIVIFHTGYLREHVQGRGSRSQRNLELLKKMELADPRNTYIQYQLGKIYKQKGDLIKARLYLETALTQDGDDLSSEILDEIYMKLAQMDMAEKRIDDCIRNAQRSLAYSPSNVISMYLLALSYLQQERVDEAYSYFLMIKGSQAGSLGNMEELDYVISYCEQVLRRNEPQI